MGDIFNSAIRITKKAEFGRILACADPEFLGVISVRIDLDQMEAPKPERLQYGWVFFEYIGISVITDVGVCELQLARPGSIYADETAFSTTL